MTPEEIIYRLTAMGLTRHQISEVCRLMVKVFGRIATRPFVFAFEQLKIKANV